MKDLQFPTLMRDWRRAKKKRRGRKFNNSNPEQTLSHLKTEEGQMGQQKFVSVHAGERGKMLVQEADKGMKVIFWFAYIWQLVD